MLWKERGYIIILQNQLFTYIFPDSLNWWHRTLESLLWSQKSSFLHQLKRRDIRKKIVWFGEGNFTNDDQWWFVGFVAYMGQWIHMLYVPIIGLTRKAALNFLLFCTSLVNPQPGRWWWASKFSSIFVILRNTSLIG